MIIRVKRRPDVSAQPKLRLVPKRKIHVAGTGDGNAAAATPPAAADPGTSTAVHPTRVMKKITRDLPPVIPFLRFESIAGRGGMAVVWRAWHQEMNCWVAVKVLDESFSSKTEDVRQFMEEVRTMTNLRHTGIIRGYGADCVNGRWFFIMDYVAGYTFASLLHRKNRLPEEDACIICESVADAMGYAWNEFKIIHCDIKPENIMVDRDGTVKVADLGLCQTTNAIRRPAAAVSDEVAGTPAYISPEQIYGDVPLDCRADVYCLGATLYHLVTGRMLFPALSNENMLRAHCDAACQAPDPRDFVPGVSRGFAHLLARMLVKDRDAGRYATWEEVYQDAQRVERGETPDLPPPAAVSSMRLRD